MMKIETRISKEGIMRALVDVARSMLEERTASLGLKSSPPYIKENPNKVDINTDDLNTVIHAIQESQFLDKSRLEEFLEPYILKLVEQCTDSGCLRVFDPRQLGLYRKSWYCSTNDRTGFSTLLGQEGHIQDMTETCILHVFSTPPLNRTPRPGRTWVCP